MKNRFALFALSVSLFLGGAYILSLKIPFWSMFLGLAAIQIGIVFIIFTFEIFVKLNSKRVTDEYNAIPCLICGQIGFVPKYKNTNICDSCQLKIARSLKGIMTVFIALFTLSSLTLLARQNQDIREKAKEANYICEKGDWDPTECRCSIDKNEICSNNGQVKTCTDGLNYCCKKITIDNTDSWKCDID